MGTRVVWDRVMGLSMVLVLQITHACQLALVHLHVSPGSIGKGATDG